MIRFSSRPFIGRCFLARWVLPVTVFSVVCLGLTGGMASTALALQKHSLEPSAESTVHGAQSPAPQTAEGHSEATAPKPSHVQPTHEPRISQPGTGHATSRTPHEPVLPRTTAPKHPSLAPKSHEAPVTVRPAPTHAGPGEKSAVPKAHAPEGIALHEEAGGHGEGVHLPKISDIPGVTFVETMIKLMEHELNGRFLGWRPNDLILGRFTDNINNYQLGVLEALRFTTLRLKDSLTRMGEADTYDRDLENALNLFMNKATLFWFPSAESSYAEAVEHLKKFLEKLKTGRRNFY